MADTRTNPKNISDALHRLESEVKTNGHGGQIAEDIETIKRALNDLKPHFQRLKDDVSKAATDKFGEKIGEAQESLERGKKAVTDLGEDVELKIHENPWMALGIVGFVAFLIGFILGRKD